MRSLKEWYGIVRSCKICSAQPRYLIELSKLSSRAASDIAGLRAEAQNEASFPEEASAMLEEVAATLRSIAGKGYEPLELQLADDYAQYARKVGALEDTIRLGKSMEYALGRDVVAYYQLNSTKMNELKKAYWEKKLKRLRDELAGERSRFNFAKQAMLLAQAAEIGARQRAEINRLEDDLNALALDYAKQVRSAVNKAAEPLMQMNIASGVLSGEYDSKVDEFDADGGVCVRL